MRNRNKILLAAVVLIGAISYLTYAAMKDGWTTYHLSVDDFSRQAQYRTQRVRLAGKVGEANLVLGSAKLGAKFDLEGQSQNIPVNYHGILPDLFKPACEVIVEGKLDSAGVFQADVLLTKCASKYETGNPHAAGEKVNP